MQKFDVIIIGTWQSGPPLGGRLGESPRRSAVSDARLALPDFYNVTIRIANVAARLAILVLWLCDELGSSASP